MQKLRTDTPLTPARWRYITTPEIYGFSPDLAHEIKAWHSHWETHFDSFDRWDAQESQEWWQAEGERVVALLRVEVAAFADIKYEPWPLEI